jgi:hypothetical protein
MKHESCEQRIKQELRQRIADFRQALAGKFGDFIDWINEYALAYDKDTKTGAKRLELSYGGPQDYFEFFPDGTIKYYFLDWFDGASVELHGRDYEVMSKVWRILEG